MESSCLIFAGKHVDVGMPVLYAKTLAQHGSRATFWNHGGIIALPDGNTNPFYETRGIYYVKFKVMPPKGSDLPVFGGQGS